MTSATSTSPTDSPAASQQVPEDLVRRPLRADARRNYEKLVAAAREAFSEVGSSASLEDIARRAGVGIGTLYRHFPTRQDLFEAVYVNEVNSLCASASELGTLPPWEAFSCWLHSFVGYMATKRALREELAASLEKDSNFFATCRTALYGAGEPLLKRAQDAGLVRSDATLDDVMKLVGGITMVHYDDPQQIERVLGMVIDGLRVFPT
jgi:AcrR family transcriptional regulator